MKIKVLFVILICMWVATILAWVYIIFSPDWGRWIEATLMLIGSIIVLIALHEFKKEDKDDK